MNALLMACTPEGQPAQTQGFLLIGTQNPVSMACRANASTALQRRMQKISIQKYTAAELTEILQCKALSAQVVEDMVSEYMHQSLSANEEANRPKVCPRTLFKEAEKLVRLRPADGMELGDEMKEQGSYSSLASIHGVFKRPREDGEEEEYQAKQVKCS